MDTDTGTDTATDTDAGTHGEKVSGARRESSVVRAYLTELKVGKQGRRREPEVLRARIQRISEQIPGTDVITELRLVQERTDLEAELAQKDRALDHAALEAAFIEVAARFSERKGIRYETWREVGVEPSVLRAAGVRRTAR
jgi:hypothetical protein